MKRVTIKAINQPNQENIEQLRKGKLQELGNSGSGRNQTEMKEKI